MWSDNGSREDLMGGPESVRLIGRDAESGRMYDALAQAAQGHPQVVLIGGDAGIGKTSLVTDLAHRAAELGFVVGLGHCLDVAADISFAPVTEAVRSLLAAVDPAMRPAARRSLTMLDEGVELGDVRALSALRQAVLEAARHDAVLVVLEDMHWADRSSQDFAVALARASSDRLLVVLTFRSEDLPRRSPLRTALAEIGSLPYARRIVLGPMDRDSLASLAAARTGSPPTRAALDRLMHRSEGNPLYAEELLAAPDPHLPGHLADLLLRRVDCLSDAARKVLRVASADGTYLDLDLLPDVLGLSSTDLEPALREALDGHALRQAGGRLAFRHGLIREAVYDDLLPDERTRTHAAYAGALQDRLDATPGSEFRELSRLAYHWGLAHNVPRTLAASVRAGVAAKRYGAAESVTHLERALALWDSVADAEQVAGRLRADLLVLLAESANTQGDKERWHSLLQEAVATLTPDTPPLLASRVYAALGRRFLFADDELDEEESVRRAIELAGDEPSAELAQALIAQAEIDFRRSRFEPVRRICRQAVGVARSAHAVEAELHALRDLGLAELLLGDVPEAVSIQEECIATAREAGFEAEAVFESGNLSWSLLVAGDPDSAIAVGRAAMDDGVELGLASPSTMAGEQVFYALLWKGRFVEAESLLERLSDLDVPLYRSRDMRLGLLLARGEVELVQGLMMENDAFFADAHGTADESLVDERVTYYAMRGARSAALREARDYLVALEHSDSPTRDASAACSAYRALSLPGRGDADLEAELKVLAARALESARDSLADTWSESLHGARLALAGALALQTAGEPAAEQLRQAVDLVEPFGAYLALEPRLLLAEEQLTRGERDEGRELLVEVWSDARAMGAGDHERRAFKLATRTRVPLTVEATTTGPLARLTAREREVLELLAEGASNRTIGETLFVTEKTASVHVSRILAKLGVPNRGAAAALARRLG
jgi:DNA-binding CsgD family transcriptional regulator/tetratricopeptide (TPR) repeat protein